MSSIVSIYYSECFHDDEQPNYVDDDGNLWYIWIE